MSFTVSPKQISAFQTDGFFIVPDLLDPTEVELLTTVARADYARRTEIASRGDGEGGSIRLVVENEIPDDMYGAIIRSPRIVHTMEMLLGDEVYHYHHKMILKEPFTGGAWAWHQDYGYWYHNGCLRPDLASCLIAVDPATRANGCLQVLRGSHLLGRVDHLKVGDQTGADMERVNAALERLELVHCEVPAGAGIFFHSNLLHRSDQNKSPNPRWAFICCYNTKSNNPYKESRHPRYTPLAVADDGDIKRLGQAMLEAAR